MFTIEKTEQFDEWLKSLKNPIAKKAVISRLLRLEMGHFGDIDNVGKVFLNFAFMSMLALECTPYKRVKLLFWYYQAEIIYPTS